MDISSDELRRQLRSIDSQQHALDRSLASTLDELFDPDNGVPMAARAQVLGVPGRRQFLRIGGVMIAGAALMAACGDDSDSADTTAAGTAGTTAAPTDTTVASAGGPTAMDLTLARTAASLEALAVATYTTAIGSGLVTTAAIGDAATLFQSHHQSHWDALNALITQNGGTKVTDPNAAVKAAVVDPAVAAAKTEADIVNLAYTLEDAAAQTYVFATTQLSLPTLRSTLMTICGVEARHRAVLAFLVQKKSPADVFPTAFFAAENPLPADALIV